MAGHGGYRVGAGRKPRVDEQAIIDKLSPLDDTAFQKLTAGINSGDFQYLKLFFEYRFGKPRQTIDANVEGDFNVVWNEQKTYQTKDA